MTEVAGPTNNIEIMPGQDPNPPLFVAPWRFPHESHRLLPLFRELLPLTASDVVGFALMSMFIMFAAGGGIGRGEILVPINIFILGFSPHIAIPLSSATILGCSVGQVLLNASKRHPLADRPLINWDIMMMMEPLTIAGAVVGSVANVLCPPWLLYFMLVVLLGFCTYKTYGKGIIMYKKDSEAGYSLIEEEKYMDSYSSLDVDLSSLDAEEDRSPSDEAKHLELVEQDKRHSRLGMCVMCFTIFGTLLFTVVRGVDYFNVDCGSMMYWVLTFAVVPFAFVIAFFARRHLVNRHYLKQSVQYEYVKGDVMWDERHSLGYPAVFPTAGFCAGLFGIGGGIIKGLLMKEMSVLPQVARATTATMICFTCTATLASYLIFEQVNIQYALVCFPLGLVCTLIGKTAFDDFLKHHVRSFYMSMCIAALIGLSTMAMGAEAYSGLINLIMGYPSTVMSFCR